MASTAWSTRPVSSASARSSRSTRQAWDRTIEINLKGTFLVCQTAIPHLRAGGGGRIVNLASVAGRRGGANAADYIASKWAVIGLTKSIAVEFGPDGIVANIVAPATIPETPMGQRSLDQKIEMGWGATSRRRSRHRRRTTRCVASARPTTSPGPSASCCPRTQPG